jgi:hypothetical protein
MASLTEIRAQNPQYNDLSDQDLADALHRKFYSDVPKGDFYKKIGLGAAPAGPSPEQTQADYLRSYGNYPSDNPANVSQPDTLRENPSDLLTKATGALGNYADAAMMGGADEALAGIRSVFPGNTFKGELSRLEQARRDYNADNPTAGTAATVAGVVANPLNVVGGEFVSMGRTVPARIGRAVTSGAAAGGVTGVAATEGGSEERALGGALGAGLGGAAGLVGQPGAELLGFGGKKATEGARAIINTLRNQSQARQNPQLQADKLLARAFMQDRVPLGQGPAPLPNALPGQGLINMGGENVQKLGRLATVAPGEARTMAADFFENQSQGAPDRAADALRGMSDRGYYGTVEALDAAKQANAAPLYKAAHEANQSVSSPVIDRILATPAGKSALNEAATMMQNDRSLMGVPDSELTALVNELVSLGKMEAPNTGKGVASGLKLRSLDYVKRALDDQYESLVRAGQNTKANIILGLKKDLVSELDKADTTGLYKQARAAWAGPSHAVEQVEKGREFYKMRGKPADAIREFSDMTPEDKELARIGFVRDAIEDVGNVGDNGSVYLKTFGNQNKRALAEVMFPDRASFDKFATQMRAEKQMLAANRSTIGGSPTSRIDAEKSDAAIQGASDVLTVAQAIKNGSPLQLLGLGLDKAQNLGRGITPEVADALANRLFTSDPVQIQRVLSQTGAMRPAPTAALSPGLMQFGRRTPLVPLGAMGAGQAGAAIATPPRGR